MKTHATTLLAIAGSLLLTACGGGGSSTPAPTASPVVTAITAPAALSYSKSATITVTGSSLDQGISVKAPGCSTLTEQSGATATNRSYTCVVASPTSLAVSVLSSEGASLSSASLPVPDPQVTMVTSMGTVVLELYPAKAPITVNNFLKYTADSFYNNLIFHRVVPGFVIQGGGFSAAVQPAATRAAIKLEMPNGLSNVRGTIAMARTAIADSATSQFFINLVDNTSLDAAGGGYAVFGKVLTGQSVVDAMALVPTTTTSGMSDVPVTPVLMSAVTQTK